MNNENDLLNVQISALDMIAKDILAIELKPIDGSFLPPYDSGSHLDVYIAPDLVRQYSICSKDLSQVVYRLGILRETNSRGGSKKIFEDFKLHQILKVSKPINKFHLDLSAKKSFLFAGGIGITPLLSMAYALDKNNADFELHYFCRSKNKLAFEDEIHQSRFANKTFIYIDDEPNGIKFDKKCLISGLETNKQIYLCGPSGFIDFVKDQAIECGYSANQIHTEYFNSNVIKTGASFNVVAQKTGINVDVLENQTIAQALKQVGVVIDLSCEQGVCGTCLTPVLEGIPDHRDMYQTDEEKNSNLFITPCCSRSLTERLVLNI